MNNINFLSKENFPVSVNTLDMMQQMTLLSAKLSQLGGNNYILSGCEEVDNNVNDGIVIVNGEICNFQGGEKKEKITIDQTTKTLHAFGVNYPEAYIYRTAKFSATGEYNWNDFVQVLSNKQLEDRINNIKGDEPGVVKMWSGKIERIPNDYRLCDGAMLQISDYPSLYENLGVSFGGDGVTNFALPNLSGRFVVGYDSSKDDYNTISKKGGLEKVTLTTQEIPEHDHTNSQLFNKLSAKAGDIDTQSTPGSIDQDNPAREYNVGSMSEDRWVQATIQKVGGGQAHENRPPYFVLAYIIKIR